eukprot:6190840-Pleurochrysis_carterae.AAC.8
MKTSYRIGGIPVRFEMMSNGIVTSRPERAIINVSSQSITDIYWLNCGQEWEPRELARDLIGITSTVDRLAIDPQMKFGLDD